MIEEIKNILAPYSGEFKLKDNLLEFTFIIAERKAFLSSKKLSFIVKMRVDETNKIVKYTEMLKESGSGLSTGSSDEGMSMGFGFKSHVTFSTGGAREETIEEQSNFFGKQYTYKFDFKEIRLKIEELCKTTNYNFVYQLTPIGL